MTDWFSTGKEAVDKAYQKKTFFNDRFFLKEGFEAVIAFVDGDNSPDEPIGNFREHQYTTLDGQFSNFQSCIGAAGCELCQKQLNAYDAWPFTIVQLRTSSVTKAGEQIKMARKLLISKKEAVQKILRYVGQKQGLVGTVWAVYRTSKTGYTIGDDWQFLCKIGTDGMSPTQRREEMKKVFTLSLPDPKTPTKVDKLDFVIPPEMLQIINYREVLKPKTKDELQAAGVDWTKTKAWQDDAKAKFGDKNKGQQGGQGGGPGREKSASVNY